jgi:hypothetical protein
VSYHDKETNGIAWFASMNDAGDGWKFYGGTDEI